MQLNKLIGRKEEVVFDGFPGFGIGLISAIRQVAGTSPESQERLAVWSRQHRPNGERFRSIVLMYLISRQDRMQICVVIFPERRVVHHLFYLSSFLFHIPPFVSRTFLFLSIISCYLSVSLSSL